MLILVLFGVLGWSDPRLRTGLRSNSRTFQLFNFFNVPFSWQFSYFSLVWDGLERVLHGNHRTFQLFNFFNDLQCAFFMAILVLFAGLGWS